MVAASLLELDVDEVLGKVERLTRALFLGLEVPRHTFGN
jgi:hypothetical protein